MQKDNFHKFISKYLPRWFNRYYAFLTGYFWLPCPLCGKMFGGHEWFDGNSLMVSYYKSWGVCSLCGKKAREMNTQIYGKRTLDL